MNVGELISILSKLDKDMPVGRIGYFGEFYKMDNLDFNVAYVCAVDGCYVQGSYSRLRAIGPMQVLAITPPDIGIEPD